MGGAGEGANLRTRNKLVEWVVVGCNFWVAFSKGGGGGVGGGRQNFFIGGKCPQKSLVYASHTINVKADFNSIGFLTCKSWLSRLTSKMQRVNWRSLNK